MKLRIDRVRGGPEERPIDRWELLADGRLVLSLEADDLHALTAEAMRADGQRQGLVLGGEPTAHPATLPVINPRVVGRTLYQLERAMEHNAAARASCLQIDGWLHALQVLFWRGANPPETLAAIDGALTEMLTLLDARNRAQAVLYAVQTQERYRGWHDPEQEAYTGWGNDEPAGGKGV